MDSSSIVPLSRSYVCRFGAPILHTVDIRIFTRTYFTFCMDCTFCHDSCCSHGADMDVDNLARLAPHAADLAEYLGVPESQWWNGRTEYDAEYAGGSYTRANKSDGACVFLNRAGRGCRIHTFCLERDLDVFAVKPMVCNLFPLTFHEGRLRPSNEILDEDLVCLGPGPTLYRAVRTETAYYFGAEIVAELDTLEAGVCTPQS